MEDIRKYINIVTEARLPGRLTYKPTDLEQEPENSAEIANLVKQAVNKENPNPEEIVTRKHLRRVLIDALKKLPKRDAMIAVWSFADGMLPTTISREKFKDQLHPGQIYQALRRVSYALQKDPELQKFL